MTRWVERSIGQLSGSATQGCTTTSIESRYTPALVTSGKVEESELDTVNPMSVDVRRLVENVAAISAEFHRDVKHEQFYESHKDELSGFSGIWAYAGELGFAFTEAEKVVLKNHEDEDDFWWIGSIDAFVEAVLKNNSVLKLEEMVALAVSVIEVEIKK